MTGSTSSDASRTTKTRRRSTSGTREYGVQPGTTDNADFSVKGNQITEQIAVFGEVSYSPNERWSFTAGLRWFDHTRDREQSYQTTERTRVDYSMKARHRPATSRRNCRCSTTSTRTRWSTRCSRTGSGPAAATSPRRGSCCRRITIPTSWTTMSSVSRAAGMAAVTRSISPRSG